MSLMQNGLLAEQPDGRDQVDLGLIISDDGLGMAQPGLIDGILGLQHVERGHRTGLQVGLRKAQGLLRGLDLMLRKRGELAVGADGFVGQYDLGADLVEAALGLDDGLLL